MANMEGDEDVPQIKLGDASCAALFTSKLSHVAAITHVIRQGRCTLVATIMSIQMYKILALNCLITVYSLSVQYLDGFKFGDYQVTVSRMLMSVCFLCISRAKPVEKQTRERPLGNIFNLYVRLSVLLQFALHIISLIYITNLSHFHEPAGVIDLEAKFEPSLLNTAIYLLGLSQQVSAFTINFQGRPFREGIRENSSLYWGLVGASAVAFSGATDFMPELNRWLQIAEMEGSSRLCNFDSNLCGGAEMLNFEDVEERDGVRLSWNVWPFSRIEATRTVVLISALYTPLKQREDLSLVLYEPVTCKPPCHAILNPYCQIDIGRGKLWIRPFFLTCNSFPPYYKDISNTNLPAELLPKYTTIEYTLSRPAQALPVFLFVVDTCLDADDLKALRDASHHMH